MPKVIFRELNQDIVALFPELIGSDDPNECLMIGEIGGKSSVELKTVMQQSKVAKIQDVVFLKEKLIAMGYEPLVILTRESKNAFEKRFKLAAFPK